MAFNRVVVLVDMDCFYVQVEQRRDPCFKGKPCAVVQYKKHRGGTILAVGYEARARGVKRGSMMGDDARAVCPDIHLFSVPESNGKADLNRYREAGAEVINVLSQFGGRVERASVDEAYIDCTDVVNHILAQKKEQDYLSPEKFPNTHIVGWPEELKEDEDKVVAREEGVKNWLHDVVSNTENLEDMRLAIAAVLTEEIRAAVYHQTGFRCSAGISHNKILSKISCGINKPNKQTILPQKSVYGLFKTMKIGNIRHLGGKLGRSLMANFEIEYMSQLGEIPMDLLIGLCGSKSAYWIKEVCNGIDHEPVKERHVAQSIGCGKNFLGSAILNTKAKVNKWMSSLLIELSERLEKDKAANNRIAKSLTVHLTLKTGRSLSRSGPLLKYDRTDLLKQCLQLIRPLDSTSSQDERWLPGIINLSVNAKKFDPIGGSILACTSPTKVKPNPTTESRPAKLESQTSSGMFSGFTNNREPSLSSFKELQSKILSDHDASEKINVKPKEVASSPFKLFFSKTSQKLKEVANDSPFKRFFSKVKGSGYTEAKSDNDLAFKVNGAACEKNVIQLEELAKDSLFDFEGLSKVGKSVHIEEQSIGDHAFNFSSHHDVTQKPTQLTNSSEKLDSSAENNDVIFVGEQRSSVDPKKSFSNAAKTKPLRKKGACKIDEMFLKERENMLPKTQNYDLPDGPILHPLYGEIDKEVFSDLPLDIQEEISKSYKITTSVIPSSQSPSSSKKTSTKSKDRSQRLMCNFIPSSQNTTPKYDVATPSFRDKRKSTDPSPIRTKKQKAKSPSTRKSPSNKTKVPVFASMPKNDVMPLGFFRQRTQLSNAISKALTKEPSKFVH